MEKNLCCKKLIIFIYFSEKRTPDFGGKAIRKFVENLEKYGTKNY
jgi:hypothetical protein